MVKVTVSIKVRHDDDKAQKVGRLSFITQEHPEVAGEYTEHMIRAIHEQTELFIKQKAREFVDHVAGGARRDDQRKSGGTALAARTDRKEPQW